jgi:hypothetical protein
MSDSRHVLFPDCSQVFFYDILTNISKAHRADPRTLRVGTAAWLAVVVGAPRRS